MICFKILSSLKWSKPPLSGKRKQNYGQTVAANHNTAYMGKRSVWPFGPHPHLGLPETQVNSVRTAETTTISTNCTSPRFIARVSTTYAVRSHCSASLQPCCCVALMHWLSSLLLTSYLKPMTGFHWPASPCRLPSPSKLFSFFALSVLRTSPLSFPHLHWGSPLPPCTSKLVHNLHDLEHFYISAHEMTWQSSNNTFQQIFPH